MRCFLWLIAMSVSINALAQRNAVSGVVIEAGNNNSIVAANVYTLPSLTGTTTNVDGRFSIQPKLNDSLLVVSFVGFVNDTLVLNSIKNRVEIKLKTSVELNEIEVVKRQKSTNISYLDPLKKETLGKPELQKAACCNLSESFETSPSVDVSFTDAVTGTRQIRMLGLAGPNVQLTRENIPSVRGISTVNGLSYTPGSWIESIQLNKGTGSVVNGFESVAGQINVELVKPETADKLFVNLYANQGLRNEANVIWSPKLKNKKWSTAVLTHVVLHPREFDNNRDGFADNNSGVGYIALNRWKYVGDNGVRFQLGIKGLRHEKSSGQILPSNETVLKTSFWRYNMDVNRVDTWLKVGKVYDDTPWRSLGVQSAFSYDQQSHLFGKRLYEAKQKSGYVNAIYGSILGNTNHKIKSGASLMYDDYVETLADSLFTRTEIVPGVFGEYALSRSEKFNLVAGLRYDYNNLYGDFITPRLHLRYAPNEKHVFRIASGRGQRTPQVIAENLGLLASNRAVVLPTQRQVNTFGVNPEVAWNAGFSYTHAFKLDYRDALLSVDVFSTQFENQLVVDLDANAQQVRFYNLQGQSFANAVQVQFDYELLPRFDVRLAYRYNLVKTTYGNLLLDKPMIPAHRSFVNLAYETRKTWKFDATFNWQGSQRMPYTISNPSQYQRPTQSESFYLVSGQISKTWHELFDVYVGVENALNFKQRDAIIQAENPFGNYFDSSLIWGPVFGRNIYVGLRYTLK